MALVVGLGTVFICTYLYMRKDIERVRQRRAKALNQLRMRQPWDYAKLTGSHELPSDAIHAMACEGDAKGVRALLDSEPDVHVDRENRDGETALMVAVRAREGGVIKTLIELKADLNAIGRSHTTALHVCARLGYEVEAKTLLSARANPDPACGRPRSDDGNSNDGQSDGGQTDTLTLSPLSYSMLHKQQGMSRLLVEAKADPDWGRPEPLAPRPIHCAVRVGNTAGVALLLEHGASPEGASLVLEGSTPLGFACREGDVRVATALLKGKADVSRPVRLGRRKGEIPLHCAAAAAGSGAVQVTGETAVHCVVAPNGPVAVQITNLLREYGATWGEDDRDGEGRTPLQIAKSSEDQGAIDAIERCAAASSRERARVEKA